MVELPVIPDNAPFNAEQRLWLNGFLAGYFSRQQSAVTVAPPTSVPSGVPIRILFGSQTGTAQALAKRIAKHASTRGGIVQITDALDHAKLDWSAEQNLLVITSTYGDGEMPDNAQGFWSWLQSDAAAALAHVRFSVLALGDRNYEAFCNAGRKIDARLEQLGAKRIYPRSDCDVDYDAPAKAWTDGVLDVLLTRAAAIVAPAVSPPAAETNVTASLESDDTHAPRFSRANPFPARLLGNVPLTKAGSAKEVRHYELSLDGSGLTYEPGDALGVMPVNCPELVADILAALRCSGREPVTVGAVETSLGEALARHLEVVKPSPELIAAVAQHAPHCVLASLQSPERTDDLKQWLWGRGVIDLLDLLPEPMAPADFVRVVKRLAPRLYSISSSPRAHPGEVHLTVGVVRYLTHGRQRKGVASTFLADRAGDAEQVKVFTQASHGFKLPPSGDTPVIMVGPGTGIAPFRAFLEERQVTGAKGRHWLFFGDQKRQTDFLYEQQLTAWLECGHLHHLDLAFSRDQAEKLYVQHQMLARASELWSWLQDGAHFYVCGDASRMAKDVDATLQQVAEKAGGLSLEDAQAWMAQLKADKRYQRDVY